MFYYKGSPGAIIGGDPEFFAKDKETGKSYDAFRFVGDQKTDVPGVDNIDYPVLKRDGAAFEMEFGPANCRDWLVPSMFYVLEEAWYRIENSEKVSSDSDFTLSANATHELEILDDTPADVFVFGCAPDRNAYSGKKQIPACDVSRGLWHTGGHLHAELKVVSRKQLDDLIVKFEDKSLRYYSNDFNKTTLVANGPKVKTLEYLALLADYYIGLPMVAVLGKTYAEGEAKRRELYGQAGSFRMPKHGFEYRVLSGNGLMLSPVLTYTVMGLWKSLLESVSRQYQHPNKFLTTPRLAKMVDVLRKEVCSLDELQRTINKHDFVAAREYVRKFFSLFRGFDYRNMTWGDDEFWFQMEPSASLMIRLLMQAEEEGVIWKDDLRFNWGVGYDIEEQYGELNHHYWGVMVALEGLLDEMIFPQGKLLDKIREKYAALFDQYIDLNREELYRMYHPDSPKSYLNMCYSYEYDEFYDQGGTVGYYDEEYF